MDTNLPNGPQDEAGEPDEPESYGRRNPLEIGVQLRNLINRGDFLTVQYQGGQLVTRLLDVDVRARSFLFDWGALPEQNRGLLAAPRSHFLAAPEGVRVNFTTPTPTETRYEGRPAFEAAFPEVLYYVQRREYFRVGTPVLEPYVCSGALPEGEPFRFEISDLSLGGLGLRTADERVLRLPLHTVLHDVEINLGGGGTLCLDLQIMSMREVQAPAGGGKRYLLGLRFVSLPGSAENTLQRLITQLEMKRRALARA